MSAIRPRHLLLPVAFVALSCSEPSAPRIPATITVVSGAGQTAAVATVLPQPIVVEVKDASDRAVRGATVTWTVTSGGGSVSAATTTTDASGRAQIQWTLGTGAGQNGLRAAVTDVAPATASAVGQPGTPAAANITSGSGQAGIAAEILPGPLTVTVRDAHNNGVPGVTVTFTANDGFANPTSATTSAVGAAQTVWTLGPASGEQTLDATVAGIATPLHFTATAAALSDVVELENAVPVTGIASPHDALRYYRITVPVGAARLSVTTTGAGGQDVDLFLRHGVIPSLQQSNCASTDPATTESCVIQTPATGDWFVMLHAFTAYTDVTLRATYVVGGSLAIGVSGLPTGAPAGIVVSGPGNYAQTLTGPQTLSGIDPGTYMLTAAHVLHADIVYIATPESQEINVVASEVTNATVAYAESSGGLNLDITNAYITQAVQRTNGSIPLVAGRDGLLRVFARGNAINTATPTVRARFYQSGVEVQSFTIDAPAASVPVNHDEGVLAATWNVTVPASLIQPGLSFRVDVDPANAVTETDEGDNAFPADAPAALDVRSASVLQAMFVPVVQTGNLTGDVTAANVGQFTSVANALYPLPGIDAAVHAPYNFTGTLPPDYGSNSPWHDLLNQMRLLRIAEGSTRYYYGVIKPGYTSGGTGLGYIGHPAAVGIDHTFPNHAAETVAHEWGHNFGRRHVDCGGPASPDPDYPYNNGRIGHHGWDVRSGTIRSMATHFDLMSYCNPTWSSDYTYEAVLNFRAAEGGPTGAAQPSLLVWGTITPEGVALEPSFEVVTRPVLPARGGRYRLSGMNASGKAFEISFDGHEIDHAPGLRQFAYAIPLATMKGGAPTELRLRADGAETVRGSTLAGIAAGPAPEPRVMRAGGRMRIEWDAARNPVLMVRDAKTGQVLSFARGGVADIVTDAAEVEINMSDGVRSSIRSVAVPQ